MEVPKELEITPEQRKPGLENPLTQEQVEWVKKQVRQHTVGIHLQMDDPQKIAQEILPQGKSLIDIYNAVELF